MDNENEAKNDKESATEIANSTVNAPDRRKLFRRLVTLAGLGITGAVLSQEKTGLQLLPPVQAGFAQMFIDAPMGPGGNLLGVARTELSSSGGTGTFWAQNTAPGYPAGQGIIGTTEGAAAPAHDSIGVHGVAGTSGTGVRGEATNGIGVDGASTDGFGVKGLGLNNIGVYGVGNPGVQAEAIDESAIPLVVHGHSYLQTANLQTWDVGTGVLSAVTPSGALIAPQVGQSAPNFNYAAPSNPPSFTNGVAAGYLADGLAIPFTPKLSGNVLVFAAVDLYNTSGAYTFGQIWYGTGTAPSFGGTIPAGGVQVNPGRGNINASGSLFTVITGLTVGTAYWFDLGHGINGGTGTHNNIAYIIVEI